MRPRHQRARCARCGYTGPLRSFEVEVALSADDSGDNDWVINFSCPACESAERPDVLTGAGAAADSGSPPALVGAAAPRPPAPSREAASSAHEVAPSGPRANPMYDPAAP